MDFCLLLKIGVKNLGKNLSGIYSQKLLDHAKKSATNQLKTSSKRVIQKTAEETGDLIRNKIADKITGVSKNLQQNRSETVINEHDKEITKEKYVHPKEMQEIVDKLRLK